MASVSIDQAEIQPIQPKQLTASDISSQEREVEFNGCLGTLLWIVICVVAFVILGKTELPSKTHWLVWLSPFLVASLITAAVAGSWKESRGAQLAIDLAARKNKELIDSSIREAASSASSARYAYQRSFEQLEVLKRDIWLAEEAIGKARYEYNSNAASLYWDQMEKAAAHIADFRSNYQDFVSNAEYYDRSLRGRTHSFPAFPIKRPMIPDLRKTLQNFDQTLRLGHTNNAFDLMWQTIRLRKVLDERFTSLNELVDSLGSSMQTSLSDFERRITDILSRHERK